MHRGGVVVGCDGDDRGAVVARFVEEVCVRDLCVDGVGAPDQDEIRIEEIIHGTRKGDLPHRGLRSGMVVSDVGIDLDQGRVQNVPQPVSRDGGTAAGVCGAGVPGNRPGSIGGDDVDVLVGDLIQRLLPGDPLPLPFAPLSHPLEGMEEPARVVHALAVAGAFLAAPRIEVGDAGIDLLVGAGLLLAPHDPVLDIDVPAAVALVPAVHEVGALGDLVPAPLRAIELFEALVLDIIDEQRVREGRIALSQRPSQLTHRQHQGAAALQERAPIDALCHGALLRIFATGRPGPG